MSEDGQGPTERQVLYALVSGGFLAVVVVLVASAAVAGLVPTWWTLVTSVAVAAVGALLAMRWWDTKNVLSASVLLLVFWMVGTLLVA